MRYIPPALTDQISAFVTTTMYDLNHDNQPYFKEKKQLVQYPHGVSLDIFVLKLLHFVGTGFAPC